MSAIDFDQLCAFCGYKYGRHRGSIPMLCPKDAASMGLYHNTSHFEPKIIKQVKDMPVGTIIKYRDEPYFATVLLHSGYSLIGWKDHTPTTIGYWLAKDNHYLKEMAGYDYGYWLSLNERVGVISIIGATASSIAPISLGMNCAIRECNTYYQYAQPNTPTGKFVCYSCRSSGRKA